MTKVQSGLLSQFWLFKQHLQWPANTHSYTLAAGFGHGDRAIQPGWTLDSDLLPDLVLCTGPLGQNPQYILRIWAIHVVFKLDTDLGGWWWQWRTQKTSYLPIRHIITLMVDIEALCRQRETEGRFVFIWWSEFFYPTKSWSICNCTEFNILNKTLIQNWLPSG